MHPRCSLTRVIANTGHCRRRKHRERGRGPRRRDGDVIRLWGTGNPRRSSGRGDLAHWVGRSRWGHARASSWGRGISGLWPGTTRGRATSPYGGSCRTKQKRNTQNGTQDGKQKLVFITSSTKCIRTLYGTSPLIRSVGSSSIRVRQPPHVYMETSWSYHMHKCYVQNSYRNPPVMISAVMSAFDLVATLARARYFT